MVVVSTENKSAFHGNPQFDGDVNFMRPVFEAQQADAFVTEMERQHPVSPEAAAAAKAEADKLLHLLGLER